MKKLHKSKIVTIVTLFCFLETTSGYANVLDPTQPQRPATEAALGDGASAAEVEANYQAQVAAIDERNDFENRGADIALGNGIANPLNSGSGSPQPAGDGDADETIPTSGEVDSMIEDRLNDLRDEFQRTGDRLRSSGITDDPDSVLDPWDIFGGVSHHIAAIATTFSDTDIRGKVGEEYPYKDWRNDILFEVIADTLEELNEINSILDSEKRSGEPSGPPKDDLDGDGRPGVPDDEAPPPADDGIPPIIDSDGDGYSDDFEDNNSTDPNDPDDNPGNRPNDPPAPDIPPEDALPCPPDEELPVPPGPNDDPTQPENPNGPQIDPDDPGSAPIEPPEVPPGPDDDPTQPENPNGPQIDPDDPGPAPIEPPEVPPGDGDPESETWTDEDNDGINDSGDPYIFDPNDIGPAPTEPPESPPNSGPTPYPFDMPNGGGPENPRWTDVDGDGIHDLFDPYIDIPFLPPPTNDNTQPPGPNDDPTQPENPNDPTENDPQIDPDDPDPAPIEPPEVPPGDGDPESETWTDEDNDGINDRYDRLIDPNDIGSAPIVPPESPPNSGPTPYPFDMPNGGGPENPRWTDVDGDGIHDLFDPYIDIPFLPPPTNDNTQPPGSDDTPTTVPPQQDGDNQQDGPNGGNIDNNGGHTDTNGDGRANDVNDNNRDTEVDNDKENETRAPYVNSIRVNGATITASSILSTTDSLKLEVENEVRGRDDPDGEVIGYRSDFYSVRGTSIMFIENYEGVRNEKFGGRKSCYLDYETKDAAGNIIEKGWFRIGINGLNMGRPNVTYSNPNPVVVSTPEEAAPNNR